MSARLLIVDDEQSMCDLVKADMHLRGYEVETSRRAEDAFARLQGGYFDVVVTDLNMPDMDGIELCDRIVANYPDVPVVVMTGFGSLDTAVAAIRAGAYDFVTKPLEMEVLAVAMERAVRHRVLQEKVRQLSQIVERGSRYAEMLGSSSAMQRVFEQLARLADADAPVLITGESGTGKELVARALHEQSARKEGPFVAFNCAAVPESLLESELFGHTRGAYTDARRDRKGLFAQADRGTLLLDEIGDLPLTLQPKLLRVLEDQRVRPVGSDEELDCDVRVVTSTNRDLHTALEEGRFREDLFYRINVVQIELPPLRARGTDVLLLAQHFLQDAAARSGKEVAGLAEAAAERLLAYRWPGNVRELRNAMERAVALTQFEKLVVEDLPERIRDYRASRLVLEGDDPTELQPLEEVEREYIFHVLDAVDGNRTLAARVLGLDRKTLYRKLQRYSTAKESDSAQ
jgi:two-component system response regulator HydG